MMRAYQRVWAAAAGLLTLCAAVGLMTGDLADPLVVAVIVGVGSGWAYAERHEEQRDQAGYRRRLARTGMIGAAVVLLGAGLIELLGFLGFVLLLLLVAGSQHCVRVVLAKLDRAEPDAASSAPPWGSIACPRWPGPRRRYTGGRGRRSPRRYRRGCRPRRRPPRVSSRGPTASCARHGGTASSH